MCNLYHSQCVFLYIFLPRALYGMMTWKAILTLISSVIHHLLILCHQHTFRWRLAHLQVLPNCHTAQVAWSPHKLLPRDRWILGHLQSIKLSCFKDSVLILNFVLFFNVNLACLEVLKIFLYFLLPLVLVLYNVRKNI